MQLYNLDTGKIDNRPLRWFLDDGSRPSLDWYADEGYYLVVDEPPAHNPNTAYASKVGTFTIDHDERTASYDYAVLLRSKTEIKALVNAERDRRIKSGFVHRGTLFQNTPADQKRIADARATALAAIINGAEPGDKKWTGQAAAFAWIAADNSLVTMDAQETLAFGEAAARWESDHVFAARALKDMDPIPSDYTDNKHWPEQPQAQVLDNPLPPDTDQTGGGFSTRRLSTRDERLPQNPIVKQQKGN